MSKGLRMYANAPSPSSRWLRTSSSLPVMTMTGANATRPGSFLHARERCDRFRVQGIVLRSHRAASVHRLAVSGQSVASANLLITSAGRR